MASTSSDRLRSPKLLKYLACEVKYQNGNYLIHEFVINNCDKPRDLCSKMYIRPVLRSFYGAPVNTRRNEHGFTALHLAVMKRNSFMVQMVLSHLPDVEVNAKCGDSSGGSALHLAVDSSQNAFSFKAEKNSGNTTLDKAEKEETLKTIQILVAHGADVDIEDNFGCTPLHISAVIDEIDAIKMLISSGGKVNVKDKLSRTPLHETIRESGLETLQLLADSGADVNATNDCGWTALHAAVEGDLRDTIKYLISINADLNTVDIRGMTPLHSAVEIRSFETVTDLVRNGALLNFKNALGETALHIAVRVNDIDLMKFLISNGAYLDAENFDGRTPLHEAVSSSRAVWDRNSCFEAVQVLLNGGANLEMKDLKGNSALDVAIAMNYTEVIGLIKMKILAEVCSNTPYLGRPLVKKIRTHET